MKIIRAYWPVAVLLTAVILFLYAVIMWGPRALPRSQPTFPAAAAGSMSTTTFTTPIDIAPVQYDYIEVMDGCGPHFEGACVNMRSGPGTEYPVVMQLRTGIVLEVADSVYAEDREWYKIKFEDNLRYPERVDSNWYVAADFVRAFHDEGEQLSYAGVVTTNTKRIVVDISKQMLYAYDGDALYMQEQISTGLELTPTPVGTFIIYKKTPSRYMQGPIPEVSDQYYDLPGVPWDLYFTYGGAVIHGAYWHDSFGQKWSHGCVNLPLQSAKKLYMWATVGTPVTVKM